MPTCDQPPFWYYLARHSPARHRFGIEWIQWRYLRRRLAMVRSGAVMCQEVLARRASTSALALSAAASALAWTASAVSRRGRRSHTTIQAMRSIAVSVAARSAKTQGSPPALMARHIAACSGSAAGVWRRIDRRPPRRVIGDAEKCLNLRNSGKS